MFFAIVNGEGPKEACVFNVFEKKDDFSIWDNLTTFIIKYCTFSFHVQSNVLVSVSICNAQVYFKGTI